MHTIVISVLLWWYYQSLYIDSYCLFTHMLHGFSMGTGSHDHPIANDEDHKEYGFSELLHN